MKTGMPMQKTAAAPDTDIAEQRKQRREAFLAACGLGNVAPQLMQADASFRRYYRLQGAPKPMLLMEDPPDRPPVPPYVMVEPFTKIAAHLRALGLRAPEVYHEKLEDGLLVLEDFGDDTYTRVFNKGADPRPLYELAVDALIHLHRHPQRNALPLAEYDAKHLVDEAMLLLDWYYPAATGQKPTPELKASFAQVWEGLIEKFPKDQRTLVLRDYHVDNLMLVPGATGLASCGLLDFQDALSGQPSYDLMSLLEDARRDVPEPLRKHLYDRYMGGMEGDFDQQGFGYAFRVLAAVRHAKVLGIFVRLKVRDGKDKYMQFIPHVHSLFTRALETEPLAPLKQWFAGNGIDIQKGLK
jgi:aminoglycoside/choline kinase family phosphotransferase